MITKIIPLIIITAFQWNATAEQGQVVCDLHFKDGIQFIGACKVLQQSESSQLSKIPCEDYKRADAFMAQNKGFIFTEDFNFTECEQS